MRHLLIFIPCLLFSFQDQTAQKKCVVTGRVTSMLTGEPLRKVNVHLTGENRGRVTTQANGGGHSYGGLSDAQGNFRFEGVDAGKYSLVGDRPGFLTTQYGAKGLSQAGTSLTLQAGQEMTDLNLALAPQAVIAGRVVDEDGDPVSGAGIQAFKQSWFRGKLRVMPQGGASTNDLGEFRMGSLQPGKYFISAQTGNMRVNESEAPAIPGAPQLEQVRTFFPDAISIEAAAPVAVIAGQTAAGTEIRLQRVRTFHVRGKIAENFGRGDTDRLMLNVVPRDQSAMMFGTASAMINDNALTKEHTFDLSGVSPGSYYLTVMGFQSGRGSSEARQPVEVGAADVNDVIVALVPPGALKGRVAVEGDGPPLAPTYRPQLFLGTEEGIVRSQVKFADDGTFSVENIGPGKYYLQLSNAPEGAYLKSVRWGQQEMLGKEFDFSNGASGELDIVFRYGVAQVGGNVQIPQDADKAGPPDFSVVLMPEALNADGSGMLFSNVDQTGAFSIKNVTPGRYLAYALQHASFEELQNPDVFKQLSGKGAGVEVKEKDNKQIQLTPVPADELKRIFDAQ